MKKYIKKPYYSKKAGDLKQNMISSSFPGSCTYKGEKNVRFTFEKNCSVSWEKNQYDPGLGNSQGFYFPCSLCYLQLFLFSPCLGLGWDGQQHLCCCLERLDFPFLYWHDAFWLGQGNLLFCCSRSWFILLSRRVSLPLLSLVFLLLDCIHYVLFLAWHTLFNPLF